MTAGQPAGSAPARANSDTAIPLAARGASRATSEADHLLAAIPDLSQAVKDSAVALW